MSHYGLFVRLTAKIGKETELSSFLKAALPLAEAEAGTSSWYALQIDSRTFGIFDTFATDQNRQDHIAGDIARALFAKAPELLETAPVIEKLDILAAKS